jgi:hypothetical protein
MRGGDGISTDGGTTVIVVSPGDGDTVTVL